MTVKQLKEQILRAKKLNTFTVMVCPSTRFIAEQYINYLYTDCKLNYNLIETLSETTESALSLVFDFSENLNVLKTEVFDEVYDDYTQFKNCVVLCTKIDPKLKDKLSDFIVTFEAPEEWQIEDYILTKCPGLTRNEAEWLSSATEKNLYRIDTELDKIALFDITKQLAVFNALKYDPETDLFIFGIYDLSNAIVAQDKLKLAEYFRHCKFIDEEPVSLSVGLLKSFKKIMLVKYTNASITEIGISQGQYNYIKRNNMLTKKYLDNAIKFLSDIDLKVRSGKIAINYDSLLTYILLKLFSLER